MKLLNPSIKTHKKLYIERYFEPISLEAIQNIIDLKETKIDEKSKFEENKIKTNISYQDLFVKNEKKLQLRLICDTDFDFSDCSKEENEKDVIFNSLSFQQIISCCLERKLKKRCEELDSYNNFEEIILHFHGGGFVSQSSLSHQIYTRE